MGLILLDPRAADRPARDPRAGEPRPLYLAGLLAGILLVAALFRLIGLNWDAGQHLHPDERFVTMVETSLQIPNGLGQYFDSASSPLNPYNKGFGSFVYGTVPLFMVRFIAEIAGWNNYGDVTILGRVLSGLFDVGTILVLFFIARRLFDWRVGALAALLVALTPMHIQQSHFFTMDTFLVFFVITAFYFAVRTAQDGGTANYVWLGVFYGLSVASKINAITFGVVILAVCAIRAWQVVAGWRGPTESHWQPSSRSPANGRRAFSMARLRGLEEPLTGFFLALAVAFVVFRIGQPYAFNGPGFFDVGLHPKYLGDLDSWRKIGSGEVDYPPSIQWASRSAYLYPLQQLLFWGMGLPLGLASWIGAALALVCLVRRPRQYLLLALPLVWIGFNWWYWGGAFLKPMRYFLVIYPLLIMLGSWALVELMAWARAPAWPAALRQQLQPARLSAAAMMLPRAALAVLLAVVGWTALYAVAYTSIYTSTTTRVAASEWIYQNLPPGTRVANEHWDDPIPVRLPGQDSAPYAGPQLELYAEEEPAKRDRLFAALDSSDVIAITSNRLYLSIPRIPERYPLAIEYYRLLFGGELGFQPIATFASYARLGPFALNDDYSEELWTVYDHPKVMLFRKTPEYSAQRTRALLDRVSLDTVVKGLKPTQASTHGLLMEPALRAAQERGGTWSEIVDRDSLANRYAAFAWWLAAVLLGLLAYPLAWATLGRLPDRGYGVAKVLAIVLVSWAAWLLASLRWVPYTRNSILLVVAVMAVAGAVVAWRRRAAFLTDLRQRWEMLLFVEAVFAAAYIFFHGIRMANPDLWHANFGGEKPMDFAYMNAILKSTYFPPYDPWLAGGYINYYYFGQVLVATLIKLTGIVPSVAYNLAIALFFGLLASSAFSFVSNFLLGNDDHLPSGRRLVWATVGGLLAAMFVALIGNLDAIAQVAENLGKAGNLAVGSTIPGLAGLVRAGAGVVAVLSGTPLPSQFDFWRSTRIIGSCMDAGPGCIREDPGPITEFPYFTFLYGDLHAHLLALPVALLALHVALALARSGGLTPLWRALFPPHGQGGTSAGAPAAARGQPIEARLAAALGQDVFWLVALGGLTVGILRATNTWDFPTYLLIIVGAGALAEFHALRGAWSVASLKAAALRWVVLAAGVYVVAAIAIQPYQARYALFYTGIEPVKLHTSLTQYLTVLGFFLFAVGSTLVYQCWALRRRVLPFLATTPLLEQAGTAQGFWSPPRENGSPWLRLSWATFAGYALFAWILVALLLLLAGQAVPALVAVLLLLIAWLVPWHRQRPDRLLLLGMIALSLALTAAVEFVALKGDVGRMNTVFKFYLQVWTMLGLASAIGGVWLLQRWRPRALAWRLWAVAAVVLLACVLIYPVEATKVKLGMRFAPTPPTDDGMAYMQTAVYHDRDRAIPLDSDYQAIRWMQDTIPGSPVILEANTGLYKWGSRVSILTGLPTVVGWDWHQRQQRGDFAPMVSDRTADVQRMYDTTQAGELLALLKKYRVEYIYVGPLERAYYSDAGLRKFDDLLNVALDLVYDQNGVRIYRVREGAINLPSSAAAR